MSLWTTCVSPTEVRPKKGGTMAGQGKKYQLRHEVLRNYGVGWIFLADFYLFVKIFFGLFFNSDKFFVIFSYIIDFRHGIFAMYRK